MKTRPGKYYARLPDGSLREIGAVAPAVVDSVICRRLDDFPDRRMPDGGALTSCVRCGASIVFNPAKLIAVMRPKICMQCGGIQPLPIE